MNHNHLSALLRGRFAADCCTQSREDAKTRKELADGIFARRKESLRDEPAPEQVHAE
jgi:hypothetical protein